MKNKKVIISSVIIVLGIIIFYLSLPLIIKEVVKINTYGIVNPAEYFIGISFFVAIFYLANCLFLYVINHHCIDEKLPPKIWEKSKHAFVYSMICSINISINFIFVANYTPSTVPNWGSIILFISSLFLITASILFSITIFRNWSLFLHPVSELENKNIRLASYFFPIFYLVPTLLFLWNFLGLH